MARPASSKRSSGKKTPATKKRPSASPPSRKAAKTAKRSGAPKGSKAAKGKARAASTRSHKGVSKAPKRSPAASPDRKGRAQARRSPAKKRAAVAAPAQTQGSEEKGGNEPPSASSPRIEVRNVNVPGYRTTVDARKYNAMKKVLLSVLPKGEPGLTQSEMFMGVRGKLPEDVFPGQDKAEWWVKCVQLDLEARGEMKRSSGKPLRWRAA